MTSTVMVGGVAHEAPAGLEVEYGPDRGLTWPVGKALVSKRVAPLVLGVLHATGGEGPGDDALRIFRVLSNARQGKGYSAHFALGSDGRFVQYLDPVLYAGAHTGGVNDRSLGIEVENAMYPVGQNPMRATSHGIVQVVGQLPGKLKRDFTTRKGKRFYFIKSNHKPCMGLLYPQLLALRLMLPFLSSLTGIPFRRADARDYVPVAERSALAGWLGHVQVTLGHGDPSMDSLDGLPV